MAFLVASHLVLVVEATPTKAAHKWGRGRVDQRVDLELVEGGELPLAHLASEILL